MGVTTGVGGFVGVFVGGNQTTVAVEVAVTVGVGELLKDWNESVGDAQAVKNHKEVSQPARHKGRRRIGQSSQTSSGF